MGKLLSALVYVFLLIAASLPLMAVVFERGVGPEDVLRGYIVLIAAALWLRLVRPPLLEPREADDGCDGDHDLRRSRGQRGDDLRPRVLASHGPF